jgi:hypothetical protein
MIGVTDEECIVLLRIKLKSKKKEQFTNSSVHICEDVDHLANYEGYLASVSHGSMSQAALMTQLFTSPIVTVKQNKIVTAMTT